MLRASNELFDLFELCGTRSGQASNAFRHWYNARVHTLHEPMHDKFTAVGDHLLNGILPPPFEEFDPMPTRRRFTLAGAVSVGFAALVRPAWSADGLKGRTLTLGYQKTGIRLVACQLSVL